MRSFLSLALLAGYALAVPANNPQFVIGPEPATVPTPAVEALDVDHSHHHAIETNETIYTFLSQQEDYTKLVKLIDFDEEYVTILNATTDSVTFFAPDNKALTPHKKHPHHGHGATLSLATIYEEFEKLQAADDDDDDDEEKKKRFKKILRALLKYHTLPTGISKYGLHLNSTYETALEAHDGSFGGQARRILVSGDLIGRLFVNYYVSVDWKSVNATNGFLYGINHPIIPPPSILDELFLIDRFSTLTSALQKVGLDNELQWRWKAKGEFEGDGPTVSLFAPNDFAWKRLPPRLRLWLFSPAGEKTLKKLLSYHIVPNWILHADFVYDGSDDDYSSAMVEDCDGEDWYQDADQPGLKLGCSRKERMESKRLKKLAQKLGLKAPELASWPHPPPVDVTVNLTIPTLLDDHSLKFVVVKPKQEHHHVQFDLPTSEGDANTSAFPLWRNRVFVDHIGAGLEGVARNGAIYGLLRVLNPFKRPSEGEDEDALWNDWEDYLPAWGEQ